MKFYSSIFRSTLSSFLYWSPFDTFTLKFSSQIFFIGTSTVLSYFKVNFYRNISWGISIFLSYSSYYCWHMISMFFRLPKISIISIYCDYSLQSYDLTCLTFTFLVIPGAKEKVRSPYILKWFQLGTKT